MTWEEQYARYISSPEWAAKRAERLALDGYRCRLCDSTEGLQVHHRPSSYHKGLGNEDVQDDLITLCAECHDRATDKIRADRYGRREPLPIAFVGQPTERNDSHGLERDVLPTYWVATGPDSSQRSDRQPTQSLRQGHQAAHGEKEEGRG